MKTTVFTLLYVKKSKYRTLIKECVKEIIKDYKPFYTYKGKHTIIETIKTSDLSEIKELCRLFQKNYDSKRKQYTVHLLVA